MFSLIYIFVEKKNFSSRLIDNLALVANGLKIIFRQAFLSPPFRRTQI